MIEHLVPAGVAPMPLEKYLRRAWPMLPGSVLRRAIAGRDIRVNGQRAETGALVRGGDALRLYIEDKWLKPEPDVLWTDEKLIVAVKPQGLPVDVDASGVGADTLLSRLRRRWPEARLCHRLDAQTGGIVLAANTETVWQQAYEAFERHAVKKTYHALALGKFEKPSDTLNAFLQKDAKRAMVRVLHHPAPGARPIETRYRVGEACAPGLFHVALEPVTGRTHQLRAHMADFGHPLLGDDRYGDRAANRRFPGVKLCLWHERLLIPEGSPLADYEGRVFAAEAPNWLENMR